MITPSFAPTATERVLPKLALDFTTASLDPRVTFTRALATATRINSSGYIESVAADTPRFDYTLNTGGACNGLLIEEARTNIATYSQDPTNWFKSGTATVSGVAQASPDGTSNAYAISSCEGVGNRFGSSGSLNVAGGSTVTFSIYLKSNGNGTGAVLKLATAGGTYKEATSAVTITTNWARYSFSMTTNANNTGVYWIVYGSTGTTAMVPWGAQVEVGAFATSYIPTTTTVLTRNADVATMTGTNFSSWFNASQGSFVAEVVSPFATQPAGAQAGVFIATDGTMQNYIALKKESNASTYGYAVNASNVLQANIVVINPTTANQNVKNCVAYKLNSFAATANGNAVSTDTSGTIPTVDRLWIGQSYSSNGVWSFNGYIKKFFYYPQRLIDAEVQAFSK